MPKQISFRLLSFSFLLGVLRPKKNIEVTCRKRSDVILSCVKQTSVYLVGSPLYIDRFTFTITQSLHRIGETVGVSDVVFLIELIVVLDTVILKFRQELIIVNG